MKNIRKKGKAVVIGGSIAGLLTARVLSDHYEEVLIVDKDQFPAQPADRTGTPHAFHPHRFTLRGKMITERLFPGFEEDLLSLGSPSSLHKTIHNLNAYGSMVGKYPRNDVKFSRAALEWVLRERVKNIANVRLLPGHEVLCLTWGAERTAVTGALVKARGVSSQPITLASDMVIDTSGRSSKLSAWLEEKGYTVPAPDYLKVDLGYSTCRYKLPDQLKHLADEWDAIVLAGHPAERTFSGCFSFIENQVAEMLLYRPGGQFPPTDAAAYEQAIAGLPNPLISTILQQLEPLSSPRGYRVSRLYRQHFEQMEEWPSGLLVLGDAYCIFDPIFGQGMTVAAMEAEVLQTCLQHRQEAPPVPFEQKVLQHLQSVIEPAWWLNCANDLQWEGVKYLGAEPLKGIDFGRQYMDLFLQHATVSQSWELYGLYWAVNTLSVPPTDIMKPEYVRTVLTATDQGKRLLDDIQRHYGPTLETALEQLLPSFSQAIYAQR